MTSAVERIVLANLALGGAILLVLALRNPVRAAFGARIAYALWMLPPLAAIACFLPPRVDTIFVEPVPLPPLGFEPLPSYIEAPVLAAPAATPFDWMQLALPLWIAGAVVMALWFALSQFNFMKDARIGKAGPAVVGFLRPRIVTPSDFEARFSPSERDVILAHEGIHLSRGDARINALVALIRCICWFNPLAHIAAYFLRIDQEFACDATVVERRPSARRLYADALLKAQLAARPLPLGCYWPAGSEHPLTERIAMLKHAIPGKARRLLGAGLVVVLAAGAGATAWAVQKPEQKYVEVAVTASVQFDAFELIQPPTVSAPAPTAPNAQPDAAYDTSKQLLLRGRVEKVDVADKAISLWVRAVSLEDGGVRRPDTRLWKLNDTPFYGPAEMFQERMLNQEIEVRGYNAINGSCLPTCRMLARDVVFPETAAASDTPLAVSVPVFRAAQDRVFAAPASPTTDPDPAPVLDQPPASASQPAISGPGVLVEIHADSATKQASGNVVYEGDAIATFGNFIARGARIVQTPAASGTASNLVGLPAAIRSDTMTTVNGARTYKGNVVVEFSNGSTLSADELSFGQPPAPQTPPSSPIVGQPGAQSAPLPSFAQLFDASKPMLLKGKVTRSLLADPNSFLWVETETDQTAAGFPAGQKLFRVMGGKGSTVPKGYWEGVVGKSVTVRAYAAWDKTCADGCLVNGRDVKFDDGTQANLLAPVPQPPSGAPGAQSAPALDNELRERLGLLPGEVPGPAFAAVFDANAPVLVRGRVTKAEGGDPTSYFWVTANDGKSYRIAAPRLRLFKPVVDDPKFMGSELVVRGYLAKDKACSPDCLMMGRDITDASGRKLPLDVPVAPAAPAAAGRGAAPAPAAPPPLPPMPAAPRPQ